MSKSLNIAIACGGTGGHLFPGLAVAEVVRQRGGEVMLFVSEKEIDSLALRGRDEFRVERLRSTGMPSPLSPAIFAFTKRFGESLVFCSKLYRDFTPDAVLGMGGFTSTPPILAARLRKIPTFVHESNAIPGKANKLTARFCDEVLLGFAECARQFPKSTVCRTTGTPIRSSLKRKVDRAGVLKKFGFEETRRTILVMGGSQGAHGINDALCQSLDVMKTAPLQFLHLTGPKEDQIVREAYQQAGLPAFVAPFYHEMEELYAIADFAVARSGAASLSELSWFGIPSILIPYPYAAEDHQTFNADIFVRGDAARIIQEKQALGGQLGIELLRIVNDARTLVNMADASRVLAPADAAVKVVETMEARILR